ncbi:hypothetical protein J43TS3_09860 [Ornithinibacillus bavariensis]|uniref:Uncharacterized protein n=1 Tax=Ornithinibacillus bavariensis TaxID=545502 RepID=A0A919X915_9BACI|nr:hypothetical protein J43TS3_09860 [Ornithinibacillus bavariensis]
MADVSVDIEMRYYHLVFERLDYQVPNRTTLHGESEALDLQDDEYIGIDVNVLYDPHHHIFMIQRNRSSLGPSGIESFLRTIISDYHHDFNDEFNLAIVSDELAKKRTFNQSAYRKLHVKVAGLKANGLVEKLRSKSGVAGGVGTVEITFNLDTPRNAKIDEDFAKSILEKFY